jgi:mannose/fructose/N-acetylgalactosamine-specific phosphotransferase system component IIC
LPAPDETTSSSNRRDYRGLVVLVILSVLEVAGIYLLLVVDSPVSSVTRRMAETLGGRLILAGAVLVVLSFGMAGVLTWAESARKNDDAGDRPPPPL